MAFSCSNSNLAAAKTVRCTAYGTFYSIKRIQYSGIQTYRIYSVASSQESVCLEKWQTVHIEPFLTESIATDSLRYSPLSREKTSGTNSENFSRLKYSVLGKTPRLGLKNEKGR